MIDFERSEPNTLFLANFALGYTQRLVFEQGHPIGVQWSQDGCHMFVTVEASHEDQRGEIVRADLGGKVVERMFSYSRSAILSDDNIETRVWMAEWEVSPAGDHVAYTIQYDDWSEDVEIASLVENTEPIRLTIGRGGSSMAWSPGGEYLAFTDYDALGVRQLFTFSPISGERQQLTYFDEEGHRYEDGLGGSSFSQPIWSTDGTRLALYRSILPSEGIVEGSIWVVDVSTTRTIEIAPEKMSYGYIVGWSEDGAELAFHFRRSEDNLAGPEAIYWVDASNGTVNGVFNSDDIPGNVIERAFPVEDINLVGMISIGFEGIYLYRTDEQSLKRIEPHNPPNTLHYVVVPSPEAKGREVVCPP